MNENEEKIVGIPESITINGITYNVKDTPELKVFIQQIAAVEKTKLYSQINQLRSAVDNLSRVKVISDNPVADTSTLIESLKNTFITKEDLQTILPQVVREVVQPVLKATEDTRIADLEQYKAELIRANQATCIPDLIKGNTREELDASLKESIRLRGSYPSPNTTQTTGYKGDPIMAEQLNNLEPVLNPSTPIPQQAPHIPANPVPPSAPRRPSPDASNGAVNIKNMSPEEFARNRDALKAGLAALIE